MTAVNKLDIDGNGRLSRGEVYNGADELGRPLTPSGLEATMVEMDKDLSGDIVSAHAKPSFYW